MMTWTALPLIPQHDLRLSRKESENEPGHDDRIGYREVHFSSARGRRSGAASSAAEIVAKPGAGVLWQTAAMSGWPRGLRLVTLLGTRVDPARSRGEADARAVREALR